MNLPPEPLNRWRACQQVVERHLKINRCFRVVNALMSIGYVVMATGSYLNNGCWLAVANMLGCWVMYRMYLYNRKDAQRWLQMRHHFGRVPVETPERALWHTEQIEALIAEIKKA